MSVSGRIVYIKTVGAEIDPASGEQALRFNYRYSPPSGGIEGGDVYVPFNGYMEPELSQIAQTATLEKIRAEIPDEDFQASDVRGGGV